MPHLWFMSHSGPSDHMGNVEGRWGNSHLTKQWLIFKTIWQNACYLIALQEIIFMVSFFDLHFESFFHPFFSPPKLQCFIEWNRHKPGSIWENKCWDHPLLLLFVSGQDYRPSLKSVLIWICFRCGNVRHASGHCAMQKKSHPLMANSEL